MNIDLYKCYLNHFLQIEQYIEPKITYIENNHFQLNNIPNTVTHLTFGHHFNQVLKKDDIPNYVTHLTFGYNFNQKLTKNVIPNSVTHVTFGYSFNQILKKDDLPNKLIEVIFMNRNYDATFLEN